MDVEFNEEVIKNRSVANTNEKSEVYSDDVEMAGRGFCLRIDARNSLLIDQVDLQYIEKSF